MKLNKKMVLALSALLIGGQLSGCTNTKKYDNASLKNEVVADNTNVEEIISENIEEKAHLLNDITPKLKTIEGIEDVKEDINSKFKEILTKNNLDITHSAPNNGFTISESTYNKYGEDYERVLYSLISENYTDGTVEIKIRAAKEFYKQDIQTESDDFIKSIYELYTYTSNEDIAIEDFVGKIKYAVENDLGIVELENYDSENYIYILINDKSGSTKELEFRVDVQVNDTLKRKYYRKEYDTVNDYRNDTDVIKNKAEEVNKKYYTGIGNIEANLHTIDTIVMSGQSKFMQTGSINVIGGEASGKLAVPEFKQNDLNELVNSYRLVLGDELFEKANSSQLTLENLNKLVESQIVINTYQNKYDLPNVDMYLDNATVEFGYGGNFAEEDDESSWIFVTDNRFAQIRISFSIPVTAEGITEL